MQDLGTEICLHESQLKRLEDAWLHLNDVNDSLTHQHKEIYTLWKYVTEKLTYRAKEWYKITKKQIGDTSNELSLTDDLVYAWIREITSSIRKANELLDLFDEDCESSKHAVSAYASVVTYNFKILNLMFSLSSGNIPRHRMTDVTTQLSSLSQSLKDKLKFYSPQSSDSEGENDVTESPQRPLPYTKRTANRPSTRNLDFEARKFFEQELRKFKECLASVKQNMRNTSMLSSESETHAQKEMLLYQVFNHIIFHYSAYVSVSMFTDFSSFLITVCHGLPCIGCTFFSS